MSNIYTSVDQLIGHTPLFQLCHVEKELGLHARILCKLEYLNPGGSSKDRVARKMLLEAEASGKIDRETVIIEPTSGNTGIGLSLMGAALGYRTVIIMPDSMSRERILTMKALGAEVLLTPGAEGMKGCIRKAEELAAELPKSFIPDQFRNPDNPKAHYDSTGPEIFEDTDGKVDIFTAAIGTGGTITGTGRFLKERIAGLQVVGLEPAASPLLTAGTAGPHRIQGIGANFIPEILDRELLDEILTVTDEEAYEYARLIASREGILVGISSGAALAGAVALARRPENQGKTIVTLFPDTGDRYLSSGLFD